MFRLLLNKTNYFKKMTVNKCIYYKNIKFKHDLPHNCKKDPEEIELLKLMYVDIIEVIREPIIRLSKTCTFSGVLVGIAFNHNMTFDIFDKQIKINSIYYMPVIGMLTPIILPIGLLIIFPIECICQIFDCITSISITDLKKHKNDDSDNSNDSDDS